MALDDLAYPRLMQYMRDIRVVQGNENVRFPMPVGQCVCVCVCADGFGRAGTVAWCTGHATLEAHQRLPAQGV